MDEHQWEGGKVTSHEQLEDADDDFWRRATVPTARTSARWPRRRTRASSS